MRTLYTASEDLPAAVFGNLVYAWATQAQNRTHININPKAGIFKQILQESVFGAPTMGWSNMIPVDRVALLPNMIQGIGAAYLKA